MVSTGDGRHVPHVSVVLTTYNRAAALARTIDDILGQTLGDFELIVCDDCSTDDTGKVIQRCAQRDDRILYRRNNVNRGMPANLNAGIAFAQGEYIANLHDGDYYSPSLLERWTDALDRHPSAGFVFNAYQQLAPNCEGRHVYRERLGECDPGWVLIERIFFRRWRFDSPVWGTTMARRSAYETVGLFDQRFGFLADVDMWLRLAERFDVAYVDEPLISLPDREVLPRRWGKRNSGWLQEQQVLERIFWVARTRHFRKRPGRLVLEVARHVLHVAAARAYKGSLATRQLLRGRHNGGGAE